MDKPRKPFALYDAEGVEIGYGTYYPYGGNVQVWMESSGWEAWQIAGIGDVLLLKDVKRFQWEV